MERPAKVPPTKVLRRMDFMPMVLAQCLGLVRAALGWPIANRPQATSLPHGVGWFLAGGNREGDSVANAYFRSAHPFIGCAR
jgi:hypothetical protein